MLTLINCRNQLEACLSRRALTHVTKQTPIVSVCGNTGHGGKMQKRNGRPSPESTQPSRKTTNLTSIAHGIKQ